MTSDFSNSAIRANLFYSKENEKTKLNWFCYELALGFNSEIREKLGKKLKKIAISEQDIADFSVYAAKNLKGIILQKLSGEIKDVYFSHEMIESYFPSLKDDTFTNRWVINRLLDLLNKVWGEQLDYCVVCPTRCISEKDEHCALFDDECL